MNGKYKKSHIVINLILSLVLVCVALNFFVIKNTSFWVLGSILFLTFFVIFILYGYERKKLRFTYETLFYVFSYPVIYLIITYVVGIYVGFNVNVYKLNIETLLHSIIPYMIILFFGEMLRYEITRKGSGSILSYILVTIILILIDCTLFLTTFNLSTGDGQVQYICYIVLGTISKNCLLLYLSKIGGPYPTLMYRIIMDLKLFILPIFPDFGFYIESILNVTFPVVLGLIIARGLEQYKNVHVDANSMKHRTLNHYILIGILGAVIIIVAILVSCKAVYGMMSIGSGSMTGTINKGDAVVFKRISDKLVPKEGDVIVFKKEGKVIVHRIIQEVQITKTESVYYTKGDANDKPDGYPLTTKDIVGVVKQRIKYIGIPSVALYELTHR